MHPQYCVAPPSWVGCDVVHVVNRQLSYLVVSIARGGPTNRGLGVHFGLYECWSRWVVERGSMVAREQVACRLAGVT
jgi:hypothetical protein